VEGTSESRLRTDQRKQKHPVKMFWPKFTVNNVMMAVIRFALHAPIFLLATSASTLYHNLQDHPQVRQEVPYSHLYQAQKISGIVVRALVSQMCVGYLKPLMAR
jgi:hypothetical protein